MTTFLKMMDGQDIYYFIKSIDSHAVDFAYITRDHDTDKIDISEYTLSPSGWEASALAVQSRLATSEQLQKLIMRALKE